MTTSVTRMDRAVANDSRPVIEILSDVLGGPRFPGGPTWVLRPSLESQRLFWQHFAPSISPDQCVFAATDRMAAASIRDAHGSPIPGLRGGQATATLFFIDLDPTANWSHACRYCLVYDSGDVEAAEHEWPPEDAIELVALPQHVTLQ